MRGSPTGAFLDGPESLIRALPRLQAAGFQIEGAPADKEALLARIQAQGRNIAPWAQGELEAQAKSPDAVWVSVAALEAWMEQHLTPAQRAALERAFGPPPGELMVVKRGGEPGIVLPVLRLGSVVLAPQPERGATQDEQLLHSRDVPPPYNYIAFYAWLQDTFQADAIVHWGTHGSLELLPGKEAGLSGEDWSDLCTGSLPVINPWIMDNIGEATLSRRRSYALLVDHLPPPAVPAELTDELRLIHDDIDKFEALEAGALQESFRRRITEASREARLDETLKLDLSARLLTDAEIGAVTEYLHEVYNTTTPSSLHILGEAVSGERLAEYLVSILGRPFLEHLEAVTPVPPEAGQAEGDRTTWLRERGRVVVEESVLGAKRADPRLAEDVAFGRDMLQRLRRTELELTRLVEALEGRYIPPGPGPDPIRNPASAPSGRNLYALNPEEIPTRPSWEVGVQLVKDMLAEGEPPRKIGFDLNGMNTMRDYGVIEAQILYLLGARPIWDRNNLVVDVELIPREELGRPRIDVFIAMGGQYKENFPTRVALLDKAVRLVGAQEEPDNGVRAGTERTAARLKGRGLTPQQVEALAPARIFGTKPGNMSGTHILHLVPRSGVWEDEGEILSVYIDNMSYAYTGEIWGEKVDGLYEDAIQGTDTLIRVWASNMTSPLSNHHAYEYLGGLSMAVTELTGQEPRALIADVRDPNGARIRSFEEVLATNLRSELLNRKWIEGMQEHGYAGAGHIAELTKNTFGWSVTRRSAVSQGVWDDIYKIYIADNYGLDMQAWFDRENPHAMQEIAATMLEAHRKGYWSATPEQLDALAHRYARSVVEHGPSGGLVDGGNARLAEQVQGRLEAPADQALSEAYASALARAGGAAPMEAPPQVEGTRMEEVPPPQPPPPPTALDLWGWGVAALAALLLALGAWRRTGAPT